MSDEDYTPPKVLEYRLMQAEVKIERHEVELATVRKEAAAAIKEMRERYQASVDADNKRQKAQLQWGISALGAAVMTLATVLWSYRGVIFK